MSERRKYSTMIKREFGLIYINTNLKSIFTLLITTPPHLIGKYLTLHFSFLFFHVYILNQWFPVFTKKKKKAVSILGSLSRLQAPNKCNSNNSGIKL